MTPLATTAITTGEGLFWIAVAIVVATAMIVWGGRD